MTEDRSLITVNRGRQRQSEISQLRNQNTENLIFYSKIVNLVLPPGCKPYGPEAGPGYLLTWTDKLLCDLRASVVKQNKLKWKRF
jgi:hypothetical protein